MPFWGRGEDARFGVDKLYIQAALSVIWSCSVSVFLNLYIIKWSSLAQNNAHASHTTAVNWVVITRGCVMSSRWQTGGTCGASGALGPLACCQNSWDSLVRNTEIHHNFALKIRTVNCVKYIIGCFSLTNKYSLFSFFRIFSHKKSMWRGSRIYNMCTCLFVLDTTFFVCHFKM